MLSTDRDMNITEAKMNYKGFGKKEQKFASRKVSSLFELG